MRENWSIEEFLQEIPIIEGSNIAKEQVLNYGMTNYVYHVAEQDVEAYQAYLKTLENAGFVKCAENTTGFKGHFYSTTYEKEDLVVTVTHFRTRDRLSVSGCLNLYRNQRSAREVFENVPVLEGTIDHRGEDNYMITVSNATCEIYYDYLYKLEAAGFSKYADNIVGGTVYSAFYVGLDRVVSVCYMKKISALYISASKDMQLSEFLQYKDDTVEYGEEAKTKLHMMELWHCGNSFVFQLKNGHFIINDGGCEFELDYLLDYLEAIVPKGEKPVIDAWLITHMHRDHCGLINTIAEVPVYAERFIVEGFYYNEPNDNVIGIQAGCLSNMLYLKRAAEFCRDSKGEQTKIYRPMTGQRYYFCDITMDIILSQDHLEQEMFAEDLNDSSTWCMYTIEGQKCLMAGDAERGGMRKVMAAYDREYLDVEVFSLLHHGFNTRNDFTDYTKVKTVLVTVRDRTPKRREEQNAYLKERVQEWIMWGDGTKILTFPYKTGSYECLPNFEWKYSNGRERPVQPNLD